MNDMNFDAAEPARDVPFQSEDASETSAFGFSGTWQEFAPIAFTNLLLTIVTLGVYSFWARTRVRRYLWSRTQFIDDRLEWTGTGLELLIGWVLAMVLILLPLVGVNLLAQSLVLRGHGGAAAGLFLLMYLAVLYLVGVAIFRGLRYRLSRTHWHGIRGGSDEQGVAYGWQHLWRTVVGFLAFGAMIPWAMTTLWNRRWNSMTFGPLRFEAYADWNAVIGRYLLFYLAPFILVAVTTVLSVGFAGSGAPNVSDETAMGVALGAILFIFVFYGVLGLIALYFYSAYYREAVGKLELGGLTFGFEARTKDWIKLILGHIVLVVATLGIGFIFITYRNWSFFVRHARAYGDIQLDEMTQSTTRMPGQGEGMLDAFDIGGI